MGHRDERGEGTENTSTSDQDNVEEGTVIIDDHASGLAGPMSWRLILSVALPASLSNSMAPALTTLQSSLLGHQVEGDVALAAFGSVATTIALATRVATFLGDASSAKSGNAIAARSPKALRDSIRSSLTWAVSLGLISVVLLSAARPFVFAKLLHLRGDVLAAAEGYWLYALAKIPFQLLNIAVNGALQGYRRANTVALNTGLFTAGELALDIVALCAAPQEPLLVKFGLVGVFVSFAQVCSAMYNLLTCVPVDADDRGEGRSLLQHLLADDGGDEGDEGNEGNEEEEEEEDRRGGMVDMFVRSLVMQTTFLVCLVLVSRMPNNTAALAAHHIVTNIWMLVSYFVDGFAASAIVWGSRLRASASTSSRRAQIELTKRCLTCGLVAGVVVGVTLTARRDQIIRFYVGAASEEDLVWELLKSMWVLLAGVQALNGVVFVIDGLLCAGGDFRYISKAYAAGLLFVFLPLVASPLRSSLLGVWFVKAIFNLYRMYV